MSTGPSVLIAALFALSIAPVAGADAIQDLGIAYENCNAFLNGNPAIPPEDVECNEFLTAAGGAHTITTRSAFPFAVAQYEGSYSFSEDSSGNFRCQYVWSLKVAGAATTPTASYAIGYEEGDGSNPTGRGYNQGQPVVVDQIGGSYGLFEQQTLVSWFWFEDANGQPASASYSFTCLDPSPSP